MRKYWHKPNPSSKAQEKYVSLFSLIGLGQLRFIVFYVSSVRAMHESYFPASIAVPLNSFHQHVQINHL